MYKPDNRSIIAIFQKSWLEDSQISCLIPPDSMNLDTGISRKPGNFATLYIYRPILQDREREGVCMVGRVG
jgi:hypothetical protein